MINFYKITKFFKKKLNFKHRFWMRNKLKS